MYQSAFSEIPKLELEGNTDHPNSYHPTSLNLSSTTQDDQELLHSTQNVMLFNTNSDYSVDWPALPGSTVEIVRTPPQTSFDFNPNESNDQPPSSVLEETLPSLSSAIEGTYLSSIDRDTFALPDEPCQESPETFQCVPVSAICDQPSHHDTNNTAPLSFNLYQRQANIYSEANLHPYQTLIHNHHSAPVILPPVELQGQIYFSLEHGPGNMFPQPTTGIHIIPNFPPPPPQIHVVRRHIPQSPVHDGQQQHFESYHAFLPPPVFYDYPQRRKERKEQDYHNLHGCRGESAQCSDPEKVPMKEEKTFQIKIPSWAKLNLNDKENSSLHQASSSKPSSSSPRLVEYIGDQYQEKNPHTRRTILLNQHRSSDNDPIVFYRFYQFSCPCQGKVWFSPLYRAKEGCYCRDCHKFVKPFGHIDGLTPYMGHELCYAKFQCHNCGRSWSCQKSRSNFPDHCFSCGSLVYPYYQVSHSVLRRKIGRQSDNGTIRFRNLTYSGSSSTSVDDDEEYQEVPLYFQHGGRVDGPSSSRQSQIAVTPPNNLSSEMAVTASASNICLETSQVNNQTLFGGSPLLGHSLSDTVLLGHNQRWSKCDAIHGRIGFRHHLHRK